MLSSLLNFGKNEVARGSLLCIVSYWLTRFKLQCSKEGSIKVKPYMFGTGVCYAYILMTSAGL